MARGHLQRCGLTNPINLSSEYATMLKLFDDAGAVRIGFTAMTELAYEPSGYNAVAPYARNPWNFNFITGGSSSGSAVAVASGSAAIAIGTDSGGSIRIPAHCCGVTGWKSSWGALAMNGVMPLAPFLDCLGLLARCAADIAMVAGVIAPEIPTVNRIERIVIADDAIRQSELAIRNSEIGAFAYWRCKSKFENARLINTNSVIGIRRNVHSIARTLRQLKLYLACALSESIL